MHASISRNGIMHRLEARDTCNSLLGCGRSMKCSLVMQALKTAQVKAGQRVGGSGGVGSVAVQIAKALGAHVTSTCSTKNMQLVQVPDMRNAGLRCSNSFPYLHLPQGPQEHIEENEADIQDFFRALAGLQNLEVCQWWLIQLSSA